MRRRQRRRGLDRRRDAAAEDPLEEVWAKQAKRVKRRNFGRGFLQAVADVLNFLQELLPPW